MDCRTARLLLDFARPRCPELPRTDADALEAHLSGCADCDALARAERAADARLAQAMRDVPVPEGLRDRIVARLQAERCDRQRRWLSRTVRAAVAAAVILSASWVGWTWYAGKKPELDIERLHYDTVMSSMSPDPAKVEKAFLDDSKIKTRLPTAFNYKFLKFFGLANCQQKQVPFLFFERGDTEARVFVVSSDQFDVKTLNDTEPIDSSGYRLEVVQVQGDPDHAFVVIYKGESLQPLLLDQNAAQ